MSPSKFACYLHPETCELSKPESLIKFVGHSYPHYSIVRQELEAVLRDHPQLPLRTVDLDEYLRVHTHEYLDKLRLMAADQPVDEPPKLGLECTGYEYCLPGYQYGLGGMYQALDHMKAGALERAYCFSLGGHHAYSDWGHGYCLLNPEAVTARYAQSIGFERILIVDWDIHHGDGTQSVFANDPNVYCISIHSLPDLYMSLMRVLRDGTTAAGEAVGHCNIPLLHRDFDEELIERMGLVTKFYRASEGLSAFEIALDEIPFSPNLTLIFSGYDSHEDDCGKDITNWANEEYKLLTGYVLELAKRVSCPVLSAHGGGYKLPVTISAAVAHVEVMASYS